MDFVLRLRLSCWVGVLREMGIRYLMLYDLGEFWMLFLLFLLLLLLLLFVFLFLVCFWFFVFWICLIVVFRLCGIGVLYLCSVFLSLSGLLCMNLGLCICVNDVVFFWIVLLMVIGGNVVEVVKRIVKMRDLMIVMLGD